MAAKRCHYETYLRGQSLLCTVLYSLLTFITSARVEFAQMLLQYLEQDLCWAPSSPISLSSTGGIQSFNQLLSETLAVQLLWMWPIIQGTENTLLYIWVTCHYEDIFGIALFKASCRSALPAVQQSPCHPGQPVVMFHFQLYFPCPSGWHPELSVIPFWLLPGNKHF